MFMLDGWRIAKKFDLPLVTIVCTRQHGLPRHMFMWLLIQRRLLTLSNCRVACCMRLISFGRSRFFPSHRSRERWVCTSRFSWHCFSSIQSLSEKGVDRWAPTTAYFAGGKWASNVDSSELEVDASRRVMPAHAPKNSVLPSQLRVSVLIYSSRRYGPMLR